jgi:hypoxanthine phosphoribosyltransferase
MTTRNRKLEQAQRVNGSEERAMEREILFSRETIRDRVKGLAGHISEDYKGRDPVLIGILNGVVFFFADLLREIRIPITMDFVRAASYGSQMTSSGRVRLTKDVEIPLQDKPVILVEDIVDTGLTLSYIVKNLEQKGPESIRICALIDKVERREIPVPIDYCGFQVDEGFLVGYGLDYDQKYRQLPEIYRLK